MYFNAFVFCRNHYLSLSRADKKRLHVWIGVQRLEEKNFMTVKMTSVFRSLSNSWHWVVDNIQIGPSNNFINTSDRIPRESNVNYSDDNSSIKRSIAASSLSHLGPQVHHSATIKYLKPYFPFAGILAILGCL